MRFWNSKIAMITGTALSAASLVVVGFSTNGFSSWNALKNVTGGTLTAGTLTLTVGNATNLSQSVSNMIPGDYSESAFNLTNGGTNQFASVSLGVTAPTSSALVTSTSGLELEIQSCSVAWTAASATGANGSTVTTYTCSGTTSTVLTKTPVSSLVGATSATTLTGTNLQPAAVQYDMATLSLSTSAPNTMQGDSAQLAYAFTGVSGTPGQV